MGAHARTDIGEVPPDWKVATLQELCAEPITYGIVQCGPHIPDGVPYIRVSDMSSAELDDEKMLRTDPTIAAQFARSRVQEGDLVYALRGIIGEVRRVNSDLAGANLTQGTARLSPGPAVDSDFLLWSLRHPRAVQQGEVSAKGSTFREITLEALRKIHVAVPSIDEQRHVAGVLNDADRLVRSFDSLIAKKRDIKRAATQKLLTGRYRLRGFSDTWPSRRLGDLLDYEQPTKYLVRSSEYSHSNEVPVLTAGKTFILGYTNEADGIVSDLPVIIFDDFTTASKYVDFPFKPKSSAMKLLRLRDRSNELKVVHQLMQLIDFKLGDHKRYWISEYQNVLINFPGPEEQRAISDILTAMEIEIAALEMRRDEVLALKQGMMQQLLTGRIRLI